MNRITCPVCLERLAICPLNDRKSPQAALAFEVGSPIKDDRGHAIYLVGASSIRLCLARPRPLKVAVGEIFQGEALVGFLKASADLDGWEVDWAGKQYMEGVRVFYPDRVRVGSILRVRQMSSFLVNNPGKPNELAYSLEEAVGVCLGRRGS